MTTDKRCGTCKWWANHGWELTRCNFPLPAWFPTAIDRYTSGIQGKDCPTWQPKEPDNETNR